MLSSRTLFFKNLEVLKVPVFKKGLEIFFLKKRERETILGNKNKEAEEIITDGLP